MKTFLTKHVVSAVRSEALKVQWYRISAVDLTGFGLNQAKVGSNGNNSDEFSNDATDTL